MSYTHHDRLTALDTTFLTLEDASSHMHVGSVGVFDGAPLRDAHGGLDMARIMALSEAALARQPRFRQKLAHVPLLGRPVWVDDERFNLHYHVRHAALPPPGDERQLKRLVGRIMSQQLDRGKPLWEMWYVEGLRGGRFAVIAKVHHCMVDGIAGVDLMAALLSPDPQAVPAPAPAWIPRPAPSPLQLLGSELAHRASLPLTVARGAVDAALRPRRAAGALATGVESVGEALWGALRPASPTPLNCDIGPHRRFDWLRLDLEAVKQIRRGSGATINDVVLAIVAGAMRRFLRGRGEQVEELTFRAMVPVSTRAADQHGRLGNRVSLLMAPLPIDERDPAARLRRVVETMQGVKGSNQKRGTELIEEASDWLPGGLFARIARLGMYTTPFNLVVTNVPGPQVPIYLLGAPLRAAYPLVPLFSNQALGIALFSYDGGLFWGFNSDWDAVPDLHRLVEAVDAEFLALWRAAAGSGTAPRSALAEAPPAGTRRRRPAAATRRRPRPGPTRRAVRRSARR